jgi:hypothetical protein
MNARRSITDQLRGLVQSELNKGKSLNAIALKAEVKQSVLWRFMNDASKDLNVATAERLAASLGMRLRIIQ